MIDEPFDNPHHGHQDEAVAAMPREVILYPHDWGGADWGGPSATGTAYLGPMHPEDQEGVRYVPAAAADALEAAVEIVIADTGPVTPVERVRLTEPAYARANIDKLWRINRALIVALNAYHDATRESPR
ncbi:MAG TPA: hypothetical protein VGG68_00965 [Caulobacteraceae bacterium]|jgi:hypothetical protein